MNAAREKAANARLKEEPDEEIWIAAVKKAATLEFCRGCNDRSWIANFEWFIRPGTLARIEEGFYDNRIREGDRRQ